MEFPPSFHPGDWGEYPISESVEPLTLGVSTVERVTFELKIPVFDPFSPTTRTAPFPYTGPLF
jgi:hypothetical protein